MYSKLKEKIKVILRVKKIIVTFFSKITICSTIEWASQNLENNSCLRSKLSFKTNLITNWLSWKTSRLSFFLFSLDIQKEQKYLEGYKLYHTIGYKLRLTSPSAGLTYQKD